MKTVWLALFNPMIHESGFLTLSVHKTKRGAEMAVEFHKKEEEDDHWRTYNKHSDDYYTNPFPPDYVTWKVVEMNLEE